MTWPRGVPQGVPAVGAAHVNEMLRYSAVGTPDVVKDQLAQFVEHAQADKLILAGAAPDKRVKLRTFELVAAAYGLAPAA